MKKIILGIVIGIVLCSGVVCAFNYSASDISYSNEELDVENVNDALDNLFKNLSKKVSSATTIYNYAGPSSSGIASTYITKSYVFTEENFNNDYEYLVISISSGGATNLMYHQVSNLEIFEKNMVIVYDSTSSNDVHIADRVYLINADDVNIGDMIFSITFRGLYSVKVVGIK